MNPDFAFGLIIGLTMGNVVGFLIVIAHCEYNPTENKMWLRWSKPTSNSERMDG